MKSKKLTKHSSNWEIFKKLLKSPWMKCDDGDLYVDTKIWIEHKKKEYES